jgi:hypothetical protein
MTNKAHQQGKPERTIYELRTNELRTNFNPLNLLSFLSYFRNSPQASNSAMFRQIRLIRPCVIENESDRAVSLGSHRPEKIKRYSASKPGAEAKGRASCIDLAGSWASYFLLNQCVTVDYWGNS